MSSVRAKRTFSFDGWWGPLFFYGLNKKKYPSRGGELPCATLTTLANDYLTQLSKEKIGGQPYATLANDYFTQLSQEKIGRLPYVTPFAND